MELKNLALANYLVGANESGKSSVLEVLNLNDLFHKKLVILILPTAGKIITTVSGF